MEKSDIGHHISKQFNVELEDIRNRVLSMGGLVEQQLADAVHALSETEASIAEKVVANDYKVNALEVSIDEDCTQILARRQPTASDLRLVIAVIKTITDLERIGDEAERIGRMVLYMLESAQINKTYLVEIDHMGNHVRRMLHDALDAFARLDVDLALQTAREDEKVDREYESIMRQLITYMMEDPRAIPHVLNVMWSARALERIGDRSCNICEYVIYLVRGKDVRHVSMEQMEKDVQS